MRKIGAGLLAVGVIFCALAAGRLWSEHLTEEKAAAEANEQLTKAEEIIQRRRESRPNQTVEAVTQNAETPMIEQEAETTPAVEEMALSSEYLGVLNIPALGRRLAVFATWSEERLKSAPCCYRGSDTEGWIIAGHSYRAHFGALARLEAGDAVELTDLEGNCRSYRVVCTQIVDGEDVEGMCQPGWDLTLFTCTGDSKNRVAVRCVKTEEKEEIELPAETGGSIFL